MNDPKLSTGFEVSDDFFVVYVHVFLWVRWFRIDFDSIVLGEGHCEVGTHRYEQQQNSRIQETESCHERESRERYYVHPRSYSFSVCCAAEWDCEKI